MFKGEAAESVLDDSQHTWFAEDRTDADGYGTVVSKYITKRTLKLINISSPLFHFDYIGKVNLFFRNRDVDDLNKALSLMPLGLPTTSEARRTLERIPIPTEQLNYNDSEAIVHGALYLYGAQRMSLCVNGLKFDDLFVSVVKDLYPDYDGYIQPIRAATALFGGKMNHPEICVFKPGPNTMTKQTQGGRGRKKKGGTKNVRPFLGEIIIPGLDIKRALERQSLAPKIEMLPPLNIILP